MKLILALLTYMSSNAAMAAACCNTPTVWTFKNNTANEISLACTLDSSAAWTGSPIKMTTPKIAKSATYAHTWGSQWYSDGMGMVPGKWSCQDTKSTSKKPIKFSTDWGENITVQWNEGEATIAKSNTTPASKQ